MRLCVCFTTIFVSVLSGGYAQAETLTCTGSEMNITLSVSKMSNGLADYGMAKAISKSGCELNASPNLFFYDQGMIADFDSFNGHSYEIALDSGKNCVLDLPIPFVQNFKTHMLGCGGHEPSEADMMDVLSCSAQ